jgi:hypothetical protein
MKGTWSTPLDLDTRSNDFDRFGKTRCDRIKYNHKEKYVSDD